MKTEHFFTGKKPSMKQCVAAAKRLAKPGITSITLQWGENWLELQKQNNGFWCGYGFIRDIDAGLIAQELNKAPAQVFDRGFGSPIDFLRDHVVFVHVK